MQNTPLVTIICLCYNHEKFVIESLNSVLNQSYPNIELLIADDFSADNSVKIIENWLLENPEILFKANKVNLGNTKTFNSLFKQSKGEFIIDLAADDVLETDCIAKQIKAFQENPTVGIVYGNAELISENNSHLGFYFPVNGAKKVISKPASGDIYMAMLSQSSKICSVSSMIKRKVLEELGGYDENLAYEDLDIWIRASRNHKFHFIDEILVKRREISTSLGSQFFVKNNPRTKRLNFSTYLIIKKAIVLNKTRQENKALMKRMHYEMIKAFQTNDFILFIKYVPLELKLRFS
jgi:glycosyltransferase involved in cell wall biosynthesis